MGKGGDLKTKDYRFRLRGGGGGGGGGGAHIISN
jgi:hypothetical protein